VSTASAYGSIIPNPINTIGNQIKALPEWQDYYVNDFEVPVGKMFPEIQRGIEKLKGLGAFYAGMSGSGSSYFGLFKEMCEEIPQEGLIYKGNLGLKV
jgi:4-diphosphocytidyl-2-C-methyl-D-erythritol kinase